MQHHLQLKLFVSAIFLLIFLQVHAQKVDVIKANQLYDLIDQNDERFDIYIYNFWATWCAPCIRELPQFEALAKANKNILVKLISLDDIDLLQKKVIPFIQKKELSAQVLLLDETDFNTIIPKISKSWSGAIPATLIVDREGNKYFFEGEFQEGELQKAIRDI